ncbi:MAG: response regulator [Candidatus Zixiibacteriota bacterium]
MAIISIVSGSYCNGDRITAELCKQLGYRQIDRDLLEEASRRCDVSADKLLAILAESGAAAGRQDRGRYKLLAYIEATLGEMIQNDELVIGGCFVYLVPSNIAHVLRVCIIADQHYRVSQAVAEDGLSDSDAVKRIKEFDQMLSGCSALYHNKQAYDKSLFDMVIPVDKLSLDEAVRMIADQARSDAIRTTDWSKAAAADFLLGSTVKVAMAEDGQMVDVFAENGHVVIGINQQVLLMKRLEEKLKRIALSVPGVTDVTTKLGTKFSTTVVNPWEDIDVPPKILLVDDEVEFVETLSERLKTRNLESAIAYDGEQALERIEVEIPDVIVLDLRMPGIDGIETLRRIKRTNPSIEVIILTGHGTDNEKSAAEELGAFAYLRKPVNVNDLAQIMKEAYAHRKRGQ